MEEDKDKKEAVPNQGEIPTIRSPITNNENYN